MAELFVMVFSGILILMIAFVFLAYPVWMIVHCIMTKERSNVSKAVWVVGMFITWLLGCLVYGLFGSHRRLHQWLSGIIAVVLIASVAAAGYLTRKISAEARFDLAGKIEQLGRFDTAELESGNIDQLKDDLLAVYDDLEADLSDTQKMKEAVRLKLLFDMMVLDGKITSAEYQDWTTRFKTRDVFDNKVLEDYIKRQQGLQQ